VSHVTRIKLLAIAQSLSDDIGMVLGLTLRASRRAKGLTQDQLAEKLATSRQRVIAWEKGLSLPSAHYAELLSVELEIDLSAFEEARPAGRASLETRLAQLEAALAAQAQALAAHDRLLSALQDQIDWLRGDQPHKP
jgi:putative transcriptional regulator